MQAMNFVALFLLRTARGREGPTFWLLLSLATDVAPQYWEGATSLARLRGDLAVLRGLVGARMPALLAHLDAIGLPLELLACDWVLSLFCRYVALVYCTTVHSISTACSAV
jgi:Rab-GTPase-TBC domain